MKVIHKGYELVLNLYLNLYHTLNDKEIDKPC